MTAQSPPFYQIQQAVYAALTSPALEDGSRATGTITFTGVVADAQTVTIGSDIYEFDTGGAVTAGNILVDVSGGATAANACAALIAAINGDASAVVTAAAGTGDKVVVTAKAYGTAGNAITTSETCANASWGGATLSGGTLGNITVGVYNSMAPPEAALPYVILGEDVVTNWSTKSSNGTQHLYRVHVYDKPGTTGRADRIAAQITARLDMANPTMSGHSVVFLRLQQMHTILDAGPDTDGSVHVVLDMRALIAQT